MSDLISRKTTINALWKALYDYEDKTEKQFKESDELDIRDWTVHRIFVQNMNDIDRKTILEMPSAQPEIIRCKDCKYRDENWRRVSVRWLPCMDVRTGSNWYCGSAERGEQDE